MFTLESTKTISFFSPTALEYCLQRRKIFTFTFHVDSKGFKLETKSRPAILGLRGLSKKFRCSCVLGPRTKSHLYSKHKP